MKAVLKPCQFVALLSLLLLCSCATVHPPLPADVSMNPEAGRGGLLIVMVRVNDNKPLPFIVDTGAPVTCLAQSLEPKLGRRFGRVTMGNFGTTYHGGVYRAPRLYLGDTPLRKSGSYVLTMDPRLSSRIAVPAMGILGMDVLKHYCVQLDFQSGQVHFLDAAHADKKNWGRPFHLTNIGDGGGVIIGRRPPFLTYMNGDHVTIDENLTGAKGPRSIIDTGADADGFLAAKLFQQWTNQSAPPANGEFRSPNGTLGGEMYHDLVLGGLQKTNLDIQTRLNTIGIHVLSRNLVTFDFPERTLYLKRTSDWPLMDKATQAATQSVGQSAAEFSHNLRVKGQLPGWTKNDVPENGVAHWTHQTTGLDLVTLDEQKKGESSVYHYTFTRPVQTSPWKLEKAWLTNQDDKTIEEFAVP